MTYEEPDDVVDLVRLLNDLYPDKEPKPGQLLKIVQ